MRLKELELQGFKTFAAKTRFVFQGGLTAIVGPNGSGKSNIADAIQWVLGEQSYSVLRAKRSEDMIFSGTNERPRMGMASVNLVLDNSDGWLPIDYREVVISRRTFRSGENEYYLNGSRVRLRDITDLLSQSGLGRRTYTVIGQGLIDQALSLRPDERRALIEEAAGITGHQSKRAAALRQLEETRHNLERVNDILQEIEPRLRYLKRQAERAEERMQVQAELDALLRVWYGYRWHRALEHLRQVTQEEASARSAVEARRSALAHLAEQDAALRQRHTDLRHRVGDWHRESSHLHRQAEAVQRELAVGSERLRQLHERRQELLAELGPLHDRLQAQAQQVEATEAALAAEQSALAAAQAAVAEAQRRLDALEAQAAAQRERLAAAQHRVAAAQRELAGHERRLFEQEARRRGLAEERQRLRAELEAAQHSHADLSPQVARLQAQRDELEREGQALADRRQALLKAMAEAEAALAAKLEEVSRQRRQLDRLQDQLDLLQRLRDEGEGFTGGTRAILRAVADRSGRAPDGLPVEGIVGTVADRLQVPAELDLAIETALGGRLQDVIVERWEDAERAIEWLKRTNGGRATFLPMDTLRAGPRLRIPTIPGMLGVAADLVTVESRLQGVLEYLLGRVVVTRDLATARRVLNTAGSGERPTVVTLEGDIVRPGGSVSGGSQAPRRDQSVLARERALRELPAQIAAAAQALAKLEHQAAEHQEAVQARRRELAELDQALAAVARQAQVLSAAQAELQGRAGQLAQEVRRREERLAAAEAELARLEGQASDEQNRLRRLSEQIQAAQAEAAEAEAILAGLDTAALAAAVAEQRSAANVIAARVGSLQAVLANQQRGLAQLQAEARHKQERSAALAAEHEALSRQLQALHEQNAVLSAQLEDYARRIEPAEAELAALEAERSRLAAEEAEQRRRLQGEEEVYHRSRLALQRAHDELAHLRGEIEHDVGLVELEQSEALNDQPPLPLRPLVERLPSVETLPEDIEAQIRHLRGLYSRLGAVNPNAPQEYAAALERYQFLTGQSADLRAAAASLERVIKELDEVMQREFMVTFRAVAREFKEQFAALFGGGVARLELTDPDDPMQSGIEIVVRPPGKRVQPLPLLSGGERSLTAAALILAILKVSPPPFCVLDEVDAALDEANVSRFCAALREAAERTQFIVITHNRGTIEAADTIYGISMGSDGASQALSLRLEERDGQRELVTA
ncbi:MAG: chromosome segregation protein SMC [Anaerolineae bacterium]|nr:chromosome segregation protein SMC [Anaerolineae bacterium]